MIKTYYYLTKPGIIYGNAITTIAGFLFASQSHIDFKLLLATLVGLSLVIAAGCVLNNIFDRDIDARMARTKNRAMVTGQVSNRNAIIYAVVLVLVGIKVLLLFTNLLTTIMVLIGFAVYVGAYTPLKHRTVHATLVGSIAGAVPIVVGYTAVTNQFDLGATLLFFVLVTWQMPHFYAIAMRRLDEYRAASIPVLPAKNGVSFTKITILVYIVLFILATTSLTYFKFTGLIYLFIMAICGLAWLFLGLQGFKKTIDEKVWARKMFLLSLIVLLVFSFTLSLSAIMSI